MALNVQHFLLALLLLGGDGMISVLTTRSLLSCWLVNPNLRFWWVKLEIFKLISEQVLWKSFQILNYFLSEISAFGLATETVCVSVVFMYFALIWLNWQIDAQIVLPEWVTVVSYSLIFFPLSLLCLTGCLFSPPSSFPFWPSGWTVFISIHAQEVWKNFSNTTK